MYIRCEQKLAECEASVLNNGQTGMILELHELRENLRLSLSRRIFSLEQRRVARLLRSFALDAAVIHVEPRLTAQWLNAKDNRDFAAAFNYGYSPERALHALHNEAAAQTHILEALVADTAWCLANSALPAIKDTAILLEKVSSQIQGPTTVSSPASTLSLATLYFLASTTPQTLTTLTSTLATLALAPSQVRLELKQTYLSLDALRTLLAALKHVEQQHQQQQIKTLPKAELDALRKQAEQGVGELQAYAKDRSIKVSGQSVRAGLGKESGVWGLFEAEEVGRFADGVADAEAKGWDGVGRVK